MNMLQKYKENNHLSNKQLAELVGVSESMISKVLVKRSPDLSFVVAQKIKVATGLDPWDYLDGLDHLKTLATRHDASRVGA